MSVTVNLRQLIHEAANDTYALSIGTDVLAQVPVDCLTTRQQATLKHMRQAADRLEGLLDQIREVVVEQEG